MKLNRKKAAIAAGLLLVMVIPFIVFKARSPVLIVTDMSFIPLYGEARVRRETMKSSLALFRQIHIVLIADDAGDDIVQYAIAEVSPSPYCVIFPLRFAQAARIYRQGNPHIPVVILEGKSGAGTALGLVGGNPNDYFIYRTDIDAEFFRAGLAAAALSMETHGRIAVFLETGIQTQGRQAFLRGLNSIEIPPETLFFTSFSQFNEAPDLVCVVLAGAGVEYLEREAGVPAIFFTWIDPLLVPIDVVLIIDDSPWAQAVEAVRMVTARIMSGQIQSKYHIINVKNIDRRALRKIQKSG
jgi:hypothetical protein